MKLSYEYSCYSFIKLILCLLTLNNKYIISLNEISNVFNSIYNDKEIKFSKTNSSFEEIIYYLLVFGHIDELVIDNEKKLYITISKETADDFIKSFNDKDITLASLYINEYITSFTSRI